MTSLETFKVKVHLYRYIAEPYWPELEKLINLQKESGMSRARTAETRRRALDSHLASIGMTRSGYEELEMLARRPFYVHDDGRIMVPELHVMSTIVAACDRIGSKGRPCEPDLARTVIRPSPWYTGKTRPDGTWERFVVVQSGTGAKLSNQRALRSSEYIQKAGADGTIEVDTTIVRPDILWKALTWAGTYVGIGASRKMGWGRFTITPL